MKSIKYKLTWHNPPLVDRPQNIFGPASQCCVWLNSSCSSSAYFVFSSFMKPHPVTYSWWPKPPLNDLERGMALAIAGLDKFILFVNFNIAISDFLLMFKYSSWILISFTQWRWKFVISLCLYKPTATDTPYDMQYQHNDKHNVRPWWRSLSSRSHLRKCVDDLWRFNNESQNQNQN